MKKKRIIIPAIVIVVIILGVVFYALHSASEEKKRKTSVNEPYMAINEKEITVAEHKYAYNLYIQEFLSKYGSRLNEIGLDIEKPYSEQVQDEKSGTTWADFFETAAQQKIIEINFMYEKAIEEKYEDSSLAEKVGNIKASMERTAESDNISVEDYYGRIFVDGIKFEELEPIFKKYELAESYISEYRKNMDISNEEIAEKYSNNKSDYDLVTYRVFSMSVSEEYKKIMEETGKSISKISEKNAVITNSSEFETAKENTRKKAEDFYSQVYDEKTFKELCVKYSDTDNKKKVYEESDFSLNTEKRSEEISSALSDWLYDETREEKATATIYDKDNLCYYIVYFINRQQNNSGTRTVKNIFLPFVSSDMVSFQFTEDDKKKTETLANSIMAEYNGSKRTENDFDKLIEKYNKDMYTVQGNGTYAASNKADLPYTIRDWCYEDEREAGDISVMNDDTGYYIVYFAKSENTGYDEKVRKDIETEKYHEYLNERLSECKIKLYK